MRDKLITEKIINAVNILDEIDNMIQTQSTELQQVDLELSDLYHLIESNELNEKQSYKIVKRIHDLRLKRRALNKEHDIENAYKNQSNKMMGNNTRQFVLTEINKTIKQLESNYKYRVLKEEDIQDILSYESKKRGRPKKEEIINEKGVNKENESNDL